MMIVGDGEQWERRLWRKKRPERVAAVGVQRSRTVGKAHTGHRNREASRGRRNAAPTITMQFVGEGFPVPLF